MEAQTSCATNAHRKATSPATQLRKTLPNTQDHTSSQFEKSQAAAQVLVSLFMALGLHSARMHEYADLPPCASRGLHSRLARRYSGHPTGNLGRCKPLSMNGLYIANNRGCTSSADEFGVKSFIRRSHLQCVANARSLVGLDILHSIVAVERRVATRRPHSEGGNPIKTSSVMGAR